MQTPYEILGITPDASDVEVKQAYLRQVKDNPPDRDQQKFQAIYKAYSLVKDLKSRINYDLFTLPTANFNELIDQVLMTTQSEPLKSAQFIKLLAASVDETMILNAIAKQEK